MDELSQLKQAHKNFRVVLYDSLAPFYITLVVIGLATIVLISNTDLVYNSESLVFYLPFIPMAFAMWYAHKKMVKDPILKAIKAYVSYIHASQLTGDELLALQVLPIDKDLKKISKYSLGLQREIFVQLFTGLKALTFTSTESVPAAYQEAVRLINIAAGNTTGNIK